MGSRLILPCLSSKYGRCHVTAATTATIEAKKLQKGLPHSRYNRSPFFCILNKHIRKLLSKHDWKILGTYYHDYRKITKKATIPVLINRRIFLLTIRPIWTTLLLLKETAMFVSFEKWAGNKFFFFLLRDHIRHLDKLYFWPAFCGCCCCSPTKELLRQCDSSLSNQTGTYVTILAHLKTR